MANNKTYGLILGRFQPLHKGQLMEYVLPAKNLVDHLIIGIHNPHTDQTMYDPVHPHRSTLSANPFSYFERHQMITYTLLDEGFSSEDFSVLPLPLQNPENILDLIPQSTMVFFAKTKDWNGAKKKLFESYGIKTQIVEPKQTLSEITGVQVRRLIREGADEWKELLPKGSLRALNELRGDGFQI